MKMKIDKAMSGNKEEKEKWIESPEFKEACELLNLELEDFTCFKCKDQDKCISSYDLYNLDGDCIESK